MCFPISVQERKNWQAARVQGDAAAVAAGPRGLPARGPDPQSDAITLALSLVTARLITTYLIPGCIGRWDQLFI